MASQHVSPDQRVQLVDQWKLTHQSELEALNQQTIQTGTGSDAVKTPPLPTPPDSTVNLTGDPLALAKLDQKLDAVLREGVNS